MRKYLFTFFIIFFFCSKKNENNSAEKCIEWYKVTNYDYCKKDIESLVCPKDWRLVVPLFHYENSDRPFKEYYNPCNLYNSESFEFFPEFKTELKFPPSSSLTNGGPFLDYYDYPNPVLCNEIAYDEANFDFRNRLGLSTFVVFRDYNEVKNCNVVIRTHCCGPILMFDPENIEVLKNAPDICKGTYSKPTYIHLDSEFSQNLNFDKQPCNVCMEEEDPHKDVHCEVLHDSWIPNPEGLGCIYYDHPWECWKLVKGYKPLEHLKKYHEPRSISFEYNEKEKKWMVYPIKCQCMGDGEIGDCDFNSENKPDGLNHTFISIKEFENLIDEEKLKCEELKKIKEEEKDIIIEKKEIEIICPEEEETICYYAY